MSSLLKGQSEIQLGHLDLARAPLERAAALNPNDPETRASLAHIRALTGRENRRSAPTAWERLMRAVCARLHKKIFKWSL